MERDGYKCTECGSDNYVVVHVIKGKNHNTHLSNLVTLCKHCHAEAHNQILRFTRPTMDLIIEMRDQGKTFQFIGSHLGISRQRVHQILQRESELD